MVHHFFFFNPRESEIVQRELQSLDRKENICSRIVTLRKEHFLALPKKCKKKQNGCPRRPLQIAVKRKEVKSKGEKERYTHLNSEFQRIPMRDKKAFLSNQCKEIDENKRMGKTREVFKKIKDTKGAFHAMMGTMKDRNGMDLREA